MKRSRNAIFKYTIVLGAAMSLSACNGIFENIYDAPIETEMEIKENSFSQVKTVEYTEWAYINLSDVQLPPLKSERNMRVKFLISGISLFIVMI